MIYDETYNIKYYIFVKIGMLNKNQFFDNIILNTKHYNLLYITKDWGKNCLHFNGLILNLGLQNILYIWLYCFGF